MVGTPGAGNVSSWEMHLFLISVLSSFRLSVEGLAQVNELKL